MDTFPETNTLHLKMDGWKMSSLWVARPIFRCKIAVSFREGNLFWLGGWAWVTGDLSNLMLGAGLATNYTTGWNKYPLGKV